MPPSDEYAHYHESTAAYYGRAFHDFGDGPRGVDWKDEASQRLRFDVIARHIDWADGPSVLDVGCGTGAFLAYCRDRGLPLTYLGVDVCPAMVEACRKKFGPDSARVATALDAADLGGPFDYTVACGAFHVKQDAAEGAWWDYVRRSVEAMHGASLQAAIATFMTSAVDYRYDRLHYATVQSVADFAVERLTRHFVIDHSYPLFEMTCVFSAGKPGPGEEAAP